MNTEDWTVLTEKPFDTDMDARRFITVLKIQSRPYSKVDEEDLRYKVSKIDEKFYILYSLKTCPIMK